MGVETKFLKLFEKTERTFLLKVVELEATGYFHGDNYIDWVHGAQLLNVGSFVPGNSCGILQQFEMNQSVSLLAEEQSETILELMLQRGIFSSFLCIFATVFFSNLDLPNFVLKM